jgi:hypothetical protein
MAALIDYTYFTGSINIDTGRDDVRTDLANYIDEYEKSMLLLLLGRDCWKNYQSNKTESHWVTFENGVDYTDNGRVKEYEGVKQMLAQFVFFYFSRDQRSGNTPVGEASATIINPAFNVQKEVRAWNEAVRLWDEAVEYINWKNSQTADTYPYFEPTELREINSFGI